MWKLIAGLIMAAVVAAGVLLWMSWDSGKDDTLEPKESVPGPAEPASPDGTDAKETTKEPRDSIAAVIAAFKKKPGHRQEEARKLLPLIKAGMSKQDIEELLGEPSSKSDDGQLWEYCLFYSSTLDVRFDGSGKVEEVRPVGVTE